MEDEQIQDIGSQEMPKLLENKSMDKKEVTDLSIYKERKVKILKTFTDFSIAAATKDITVLNLPPNAEIQSIYMNVDVAFAGSGLSNIKLSVGPSGTPTTLLTAQAVNSTGVKSMTGTDITSNRAVYSVSAYTTIVIEATCSGGNLSALTAGIVSLYIQYG